MAAAGRSSPPTRTTPRRSQWSSAEDPYQVNANIGNSPVPEEVLPAKRPTSAPGAARSRPQDLRVSAPAPETVAAPAAWRRPGGRDSALRSLGSGPAHARRRERPSPVATAGNRTASRPAGRSPAVAVASGTARPSSSAHASPPANASPGPVLSITSTSAAPRPRRHRRRPRHIHRDGGSTCAVARRGWPAT